MRAVHSPYLTARLSTGDTNRSGTLGLRQQPWLMGHSRYPTLKSFVESRPAPHSCAELEAISSPKAVRHALRTGVIVRLFRDTYVAGIHHESFEARALAAMRWRGSNTIIAGQSALFIWGLLDAPTKIHLVTTATSGMHCPDWLTVNRVSYVCPTATWNGVEVELPAWAIVQTYGSLPARVRRELLYRALARGSVTASDLYGAVAGVPRVKSKHQLLQTIAAAAQGSESYLEERSLYTVFNLKEFSGLVRQHVVRVDGKRFRLDLYDPQTKTAIEHDGAAYHGHLEQRESDLRRDALLASHGIQTVRFSYKDIVANPQQCRDVVRMTLKARAER